MATPLRFVATSALGTEDALLRELRAMGIHRAKVGKGYVRFQGDLRAGYRACLWSRVASRVFLEIAHFEAMTSDGLYAGLRDIDWRTHLRPDGTLWIDFVGRSREIRDERFGAQRSKDAICDQLRAHTGRRPSVEPKQPDVRFRVLMRDGFVTVSVDLSGEALHRRSAMRHTGPAPLRETLAAAVLWYADWPKRSRRGEPLHDPMCGSGTFLVEAADMAMDVAPGLRRSRWGFDRWLGHSETVWLALREEAAERQQARASERDALRLVGGDADAQSVRAAKDNITAAGWDDIIRIARCPVTEARPKTADPGLLVVNPPYGQRLSSPEQAAAIHGDLGNTLRHHFLGWTAGILTEHPLVGSVGLRPHRRIPIRNGPLDCRLALFDIAETAPQGRTQP